MTESNEQLRQRILASAAKLPADQLPRLADYISLLEATASRDQAVTRPTLYSQPAPLTTPDWPHAPLHRVSNHGTFIVTASTLHKLPLFRGGAALDLLHDTLLKLAKQHGWTLEAWAVFPNHYHIVAHGGESASKLDAFLTHLHADTGNCWGHRGTAGDTALPWLAKPEVSGLHHPRSRQNVVSPSQPPAHSTTALPPAPAKMLCPQAPKPGPGNLISGNERAGQGFSSTARPRSQTLLQGTGSAPSRMD